MELSLHELKQLSQALSYAIVNSPHETQTAEFAMLKVKVEGQIVRQEEHLKRKTQHSKMNCQFHYCDSNPPCKDKCHYS